jgi:hypothetical protein
VKSAFSADRFDQHWSVRTLIRRVQRIPRHTQPSFPTPTRTAPLLASTSAAAGLALLAVGIGVVQAHEGGVRLLCDGVHYAGAEAARGVCVRGN